ncbi:MAG: carbohydrate kinase family protein [Minisyncoccales bacterium]
MFDVITFGSATNDYFLTLKEDTYKVKKNKDSITGENLVFPLGSKIEVENLFSSTGGGGTNSAVTFAKQGLKTTYIGNVGKDESGKEIIKILKENGVETKFINEVDDFQTAYSAILSVPNKERTILVYRGACHYMKEKDIAWNKIKNTKWFYLAPISEKSVELTQPLINFAKKNNIKVAANLSKDQIDLGLDNLKPILSSLKVLLLNEEESTLLSGVKNNKKAIEKLINYIDGIVVITRGEKGVIAGNKEKSWKAGTPNTKVVEKTGAGDSFGSGFVTGLIKEKNIEFSIQLGIANASSCIKEKGAKNGLLSKDDWGNALKVKVNTKKKN